MKKLSILNVLHILMTISIYHTYYSCFLVLAIILFEQRMTPLGRGEVLTVKLRSDHATITSTIHNSTISFYKTSYWWTSKEFFGQHVHDPAGQYALMRRLLEGNELTYYFNHSTVQHVKEAERFCFCKHTQFSHSPATSCRTEIYAQIHLKTSKCLGWYADEWVCTCSAWFKHHNWVLWMVWTLNGPHLIAILHWTKPSKPITKVSLWPSHQVRH